MFDCSALEWIEKIAQLLQTQKYVRSIRTQRSQLKDEQLSTPRDNARRTRVYNYNVYSIYECALFGISHIYTIHICSGRKLQFDIFKWLDLKTFFVMCISIKNTNLWKVMRVVHRKRASCIRRAVGFEPRHLRGPRLSM